MVHEELAVTEHTVREVRGRGVEDHDLRRHLQLVLDVGFEPEKKAVKSWRWIALQKHGDVDIAASLRRRARDTAEEVRGCDVATPGGKEAPKPGFDLGLSLHDSDYTSASHALAWTELRVL